MRKLGRKRLLTSLFSMLFINYIKNNFTTTLLKLQLLSKSVSILFSCLIPKLKMRMFFRSKNFFPCYATTKIRHSSVPGHQHDCVISSCNVKNQRVNKCSMFCAGITFMVSAVCALLYILPLSWRNSRSEIFLLGRSQEKHAIRILCVER